VWVGPALTPARILRTSVARRDPPLDRPRPFK